jgi:hypothetical protein
MGMSGQIRAPAALTHGFEIADSYWTGKCVWGMVFSRMLRRVALVRRHYSSQSPPWKPQILHSIKCSPPHGDEPPGSKWRGGLQSLIWALRSLLPLSGTETRFSVIPLYQHIYPGFRNIILRLINPAKYRNTEYGNREANSKTIPVAGRRGVYGCETSRIPIL